jgi:hypothetical protein
LLKNAAALSSTHRFLERGLGELALSEQLSFDIPEKSLDVPTS